MRSHICGTCSRSFARLEHLKRHVRSHTKEKPFECPQCTRCFARRDLLLRHQQRLHQQDAISSAPRNGCRKTTTGLPPNATRKVRKNSVASSVDRAASTGTARMRPLANAQSHIDPSAFNSLLASHDASLARSDEDHPGHAHYTSLPGLKGPSAFGYRDISTSIGNQRHHHGLPKLDAHVGFDLSGLRTAPSSGCRSDEFELDSSGLTINPNQLHRFKGNTANPQPLFPSPFSTSFAGTALIADDLCWSTGLGHCTIFRGADEVGIDKFSPSTISTISECRSSEVLDGFRQPTSAAM